MSPPWATQRRPLSQIAAPMPASSIRPYMWIVSGPTSTVPLDGEGIEATRATARFCPPPRSARGSSDLQEDLHGQLGSAEAQKKVDCGVQVDFRPERQL